MGTEVEHSRFSYAGLWLRFVAWIFKLGGALFVVIGVLSLVGIMTGSAPPQDSPPQWVLLLLVLAMAVALIATGVLLARRSRVGAILGLLLTLYPTLFIFAGRRPFEWSDAIVDVITIVVIVSIWPQLTSW